LWAGTTIENLADEHRKIINDSVLELRNKNSLKNKVIRLAELLFIFVCVGILLYLTKRFFRFIIKKVNKSVTILNQGIKVRNYEIINSKQIRRSVIKTLKLIKFVFYFIILFFSIPIALRIFPATEIWATELQKVILDPLQSAFDSLVDYMPSLINIIIIRSEERRVGKENYYMC